VGTIPSQRERREAACLSTAFLPPGSIKSPSIASDTRPTPQTISQPSQPDLLTADAHKALKRRREGTPPREFTWTMESAAPVIARPSLPKKPSPSFRLRNGSLNVLRLRRVFDLFDRNGDGEITLDEMAAALDALGLGADRPGLQAAVGAYIPAGAAGLRFDDFQSLHRALGDALFGPIPETVPEEDVEGDMEEAFRVFDEDGDGFISAAELQAVLRKLGLSEARNLATVQEMICSVDRNCDGRVDFREFKNMMMQGVTVWGA
jgi:calcium-binding protein CML